MKACEVELVKVAAVQAAPVVLDSESTVDHIERLTAEAAEAGAGLIVFPEAFIPTYPDWIWRSRPWTEAPELFGRLLRESVVVPGPITQRLGQLAARVSAYVAIGVNERDRFGSTLYNTLLVFDDHGNLVIHRRKLMPTGPERMVWGVGDGSTLTVVNTPFGRLGGLICWENYMPLARAAMYAQGIDILVAPTWDRGDTWVSTLRHIGKEGRVFVVGVASCIHGSDVPSGFPGRQDMYGGEDDWLNDGWSAIADHTGTLLAGPLIKETGILYAQLDANRARASRKEFDPTGHYSRPDVFSLTINTTPLSAVRFDSPAPLNPPAAPEGADSARFVRVAPRKRRQR